MKIPATILEGMKVGAITASLAMVAGCAPQTSPTPVVPDGDGRVVVVDSGYATPPGPVQTVAGETDPEPENTPPEWAAPCGRG